MPEVEIACPGGEVVIHLHGLESDDASAVCGKVTIPARTFGFGGVRSTAPTFSFFDIGSAHRMMHDFGSPRGNMASPVDATDEQNGNLTGFYQGRNISPDEGFSPGTTT